MWVSEEYTRSYYSTKSIIYFLFVSRCTHYIHVVSLFVCPVETHYFSQALYVKIYAEHKWWRRTAKWSVNNVLYIRVYRSPSCHSACCIIYPQQTHILCSGYHSDGIYEYSISFSLRLNITCKDHARKWRSSPRSQFTWSLDWRSSSVLLTAYRRPHTMMRSSRVYIIRHRVMDVTRSIAS